MATSLHPSAELSLPLQRVDFEKTPPVVGTPEQIREQARGFSHVATLREHDRIVG
jgi:hypothetical protein